MHFRTRSFMEQTLTASSCISKFSSNTSKFLKILKVLYLQREFYSSSTSNAPLLFVVCTMPRLNYRNIYKFYFFLTQVIQIELGDRKNV